MPESEYIVNEVPLLSVIFNNRTESAKVGWGTVIKITYDAIMYPGKKESVTILHKNGKLQRVYDMDEVIYEPDIK